MEEIEKRKLERFDLKIPAKIEVKTSDKGEEVLNLLTSDISSGGAFFKTDRLLPEGTKVTIDLTLPIDKMKKIRTDFQKALLEVTGTVLRSESQGMAICFDKDYLIHPWRERQLTKS